MSIIFVALLVMGSNKETMLLNINKSNRVYSVTDGNVVKNDYVFLFTNTQAEDHKFYFEIVGRDDITIERPGSPFTVRADQKAKKIVVLSADKVIGTNPQRDTEIPLTIRAYAVDAPDQVFVIREAVFVYPPLQEVAP